MLPDPERRASSMSDIIFLALGVGSFILLAAYAHFTAKA